MSLGECWKCLRRKNKWLKKVRKIPGYNQNIEIEFLEEQVIIKGENFKSEMEWDYFSDHKIYETNVNVIFAIIAYT